MPAFGLAAVPLPTKNRKILPGCHPPIADALGEPTPDTDETADGSTGAPVLTAAAGFTGRDTPPNSRRAAANAVHANGAAAGPSPSAPPPNHANTEPPRPLTRPDTAADITGGAATGAASTTSTASDPQSGPSAATGESSTATGESTSTTRAGRGEAPTAPTFPTTSASSTTPATTDSGRPARADEPAEPGSLAAESRPPATAVESPSDTEDTDPRPPARAGTSVEGSAESAPEPPRPVRAAPRAGFVDPDPDDVVDAESDDAAESEDPVEPPDPVVSANATGTATTADPTPSATANAPTRPTWMAYPRDAVSVTARRPYSIDRTQLRRRLVVSAAVASAELRVESAAFISEGSFDGYSGTQACTLQIVASVSSSKHPVKRVRGVFTIRFPGRNRGPVSFGKTPACRRLDRVAMLTTELGRR